MSCDSFILTELAAKTNLSQNHSVSAFWPLS